MMCWLFRVLPVFGSLFFGLALQAEVTIGSAFLREQNGNFYVNVPGCSILVGGAWREENLLTVDGGMPILLEVSFDIAGNGFRVCKVLYRRSAAVDYQSRTLISLESSEPDADAALLVHDFVKPRKTVKLDWIWQTPYKPGINGDGVLTSGHSRGPWLSLRRLVPADGSGTFAFQEMSQAPVDARYRNCFSVSVGPVAEAWRGVNLLMFMQFGFQSQKALLQSFVDRSHDFVVSSAGFIVRMSADERESGDSIELAVPDNGQQYRLLLLDLNAGDWRCIGPDGRSTRFVISPDAPVFCAVADRPGRWRFEKVDNKE